MNMKGIESLTDIHAHIIYGVDDGARTPKESLKLISTRLPSKYYEISDALNFE